MYAAKCGWISHDRIARAANSAGLESKLPGGMESKGNGPRSKAKISQHSAVRLQPSVFFYGGTGVAKQDTP
jgi:hypothetical protein